jgi:sulfinoalanine decarboxylase
VNCRRYCSWIGRGSEGDWNRIFDWIEQYLQYGVNTAHPTFANRMWTKANLPSMLAEMVVAISNTSSCTYESAPVSTLVEKHMIQQMLDLIGFTHGEGQMTTGSSNANMVAIKIRDIPHIFCIASDQRPPMKTGECPDFF